jgi:CMP-N,N'-diacetyllegionaminic acid synthase
MKILGIIIARKGSKGIPGKNKKLLSGIPLISYTINAAIQSDLFKVIISTDDDDVIEIAKKVGLDVPFKRPAELASDSAKSIDVVVHALNEVERIFGEKYDAVMMLQPTNPFRTIEDINQAIALLKNHPDADSVISVVDVLAHHPARMKYIQNGFLIDPPFCEQYENQNRQELIPMYIRNGAIYLTRCNILLQKSFKGAKSLALVMPPERSINIDTLSDFAMAEYQMNKYNYVNENFTLRV